MTEFIKSAFNIFSNASTISKSSATVNDYVGQNILVGNLRLRVTRQLAEGGFAIIYAAQDQATGNEYALKVILKNKGKFKLFNFIHIILFQRMFSADSTTSRAIMEEIDYLVNLNNKSCKKKKLFSL